jgi:hypothetical protein
MGNTWSKRLRNEKKICFMGHRKWLLMDHSFRMDNQSFDGTQEMDPPPIVQNGDEIMSQLEEVDWVADQPYIVKKQNIVGTSPEMPVFWKKNSIFFFALPYWKDNLLRHNLDVMHIEKNVVDNIIGTILNIKGKTKDNINARLDLEEMGLRSDLHPVCSNPNKPLFPPNLLHNVKQTER